MQKRSKRNDRTGNALSRFRRWRRGALALATFLIFFGWMLRRFEHSQVYQPSFVLEATATQLGRPVEDLFISMDGVPAVHAWFFPAPSSDAFVFLVCHGNGGNISHRVDLYEILFKTGAAVLAFDYRGYGRSPGAPGEEKTYADAQAAHNWLRTRGFAPEQIVVLGESLGGGVATELAVREKIGALILQSTFTSICDVGGDLFPWLPVKLINTIRYDTRNKLPGIRVPVLILHSRADSMIRFAHAEKNFAAANTPKYLEEISGDHNGPLDAAALQRAIDRLLRTLPPVPEHSDHG